MTLEQIGLGVFCLFMVIAIVCALVDHDHRKKDNRNVRLPRNVSWDRASKYYEDRT